MIEVHPGVLAAIITILCAVIGGIFGLWFRVEAKVAQAVKWREEEDEKLRTRIDNTEGNSSSRYQAVMRDANDFKLLVAREYIRRSDLKDTEDRLVTAIDKLESAMDKVIARLDSIAHKIVPGG